MSVNSILLIEDERINVMAFKRGLSRVNDLCKLIVHETAESALAYLRSEPEIPDLIILDLNLPKMNGVDFLKIIKSDNFYKRIPIVILTTSVNPQDKFDCFDLQIAGYFIKPLDYFELIESICDYWENSQLAGSYQNGDVLN